MESWTAPGLDVLKSARKFLPCSLHNIPDTRLDSLPTSINAAGVWEFVNSLDMLWAAEW